MTEMTEKRKRGTSKRDDVDSDEGRLPVSAYRCFWDIDPTNLDVDRYSRYVIERLLEYGDLSSVRWMERYFSREEIVKVLKTSRALSPKSANFWLTVLNVPREEVRCMSSAFQRKYRKAWNW